MRAILVLLLLAALAACTDEGPPDPLAGLTKAPLPDSVYPTPPRPTPSVTEGAYDEMTHSPAVRQAIADLVPANNGGSRSVIEDVLEQEHAVWCLQACLCHPNPDVQIHALGALRRLQDPKAVPFLLIYTEYEAVFLLGGEAAAIQGALHTELAATLSALTGIVVEVRDQAPDTLLKALPAWRKWLLAQPPSKV